MRPSSLATPHTAATLLQWTGLGCLLLTSCQTAPLRTAGNSAAGRSAKNLPEGTHSNAPAHSLPAMPLVLEASISARPTPNPVSETTPPAESSASNYEDEDIGTRAKDPIEKINRGTFAFNHQFYRFIGRPLAKLTTAIIPPPAMDALGNFFDNLKSPVRISASLLQANFKRATQETAKFALNSTAGIGGLRKASDHVDSLKNIPKEDFGRTFGKWGIPMGPYLVLPVVGPRSVRDLVGEVADTCATPQTWISNETLRYSLTGTKALIENPDRIDLYDSTTKDALDPYISMREAYTNYRNRR